MHSYNRWLVLAACVAALWTSWLCWLGDRPYGRGPRISGRAFAGLLDFQLALGLVLYVLSPLARTGLADLGAAMAVKELRFFAVEHITGMLIAATLVHVGSSRVRRATGDADKLRRAVLWQTLGALAIVLSIPWWRPLLRV